MSRCIPFPPPGYVWNRVSGEALVELIKLKGETAKAEKERKKEERRRNKEEKRRNKEKTETREDREIRDKSLCQDTKQKDDKSKKCLERTDNQRKRKYETEELESNLTEEFEQAMVCDSVYDSSDNSQCPKRKTGCCSLSGCHNHASIISVEPSVSLPTEVLANEKAELALTSCDSESSSLQTELQLREFLLNWCPPNMQTPTTEFDNQSWLFETRLPKGDKTEKSQANSDILCNGSSLLYPCARDLPHDNFYALPYTVPF